MKPFQAVVLVVAMMMAWAGPVEAQGGRPSTQSMFAEAWEHRRAEMEQQRKQQFQIFFLGFTAVGGLIAWSIWSRTRGVPHRDDYAKLEGATDLRGRPQCISCEKSSFFLERGPLATIHICRICGDRCFKT